MRVAYLGLAYHRRTGSSRFLLDLLERHAEVEAFFAEPDVADVRSTCAGFDETRYDAIIIWQLHEAFALLSGRHPNVTFAPMYDAMFRGGAFTWRPFFNAAKILCFSWALRREVMRRAPVYAHAQYFPAPSAQPPAARFDELRGAFWYRRRDIPPEAVFALTAGTRFARLSIHDAPDPGHEAPFPGSPPAHIGTLARTTWSVDGQAFADALRDANVFFASRPLEGIGMSFLEAMAAGLCVVAPDAPTMNEVISHGANGLLHAPGSRTGLDFTRAREIGARARDSVALGRARWEASLPALMEFLGTPTARLAARAGRRGVFLRAPAAAGAPPALTIIVPADGTEAARAGTLASLSALTAQGVTVLEGTGTTTLAAIATPWLLVLPPGDAWADAAQSGAPAPDAGAGAILARVLAEAPPEAVAIRGHHLLRAADGSEALCRTAEPAAAWARLRRGEAGPDGPLGLGVPAATLLRVAWLRRLDAMPPTTAPDLAALLLRALDERAMVQDVEQVLAIHAAPADPAAQRAAWAALVALREGPQAAADALAAMAAAGQAAAATAAAARPARLALDVVGALDALFPPLGRAAERLLLGGGVRRLRGLLAGLRGAGQDARR